MLDALMISIIYIAPFIIAITVGAFVFENLIPAILRRRARRVKNDKR